MIEFYGILNRKLLRVSKNQRYRVQQTCWVQKFNLEVDRFDNYHKTAKVKQIIDKFYYMIKKTLFSACFAIYAMLCEHSVGSQVEFIQNRLSGQNRQLSYRNYSYAGFSSDILLALKTLLCQEYFWKFQQVIIPIIAYNPENFFKQNTLRNCFNRSFFYPYKEVQPPKQ